MENDNIRGKKTQSVVRNNYFKSNDFRNNTWEDAFSPRSNGIDVDIPTFLRH